MHWLHKAYKTGYEACLRADEYCPYIGKESDWWWAGWSDAIPEKQRLDNVNTRRTKKVG